MITIDLICEACGEANPPGTEFCRNCNAYLAWGGSTPKPGQPTPQTVSKVAAPTVQNAPTVPMVPTIAATPVAEQHQHDTGEQGYQQDAYQQQDRQQETYPDFPCPACGRINPSTRRFCVHCGYSFVADFGTDPSVDWSAWTPQATAARDREAKRAYRRSLPPLYRWRRVIIGVVVFALFVGLGALLRRDPAALAQDAWYRVNHEYVTVAGVQAQVDPADASAPGSDPQLLLDGTEQEWTMAWQPTGESSCGAAPGTGTLIFTFPATQIRRVIIAPGLAEKNSQRPTQPRPRAIGISLGDGPCRPFTLADDFQQQRLTVDSDTPVTRLTLGIGSAYSGGASTQQISLTEVWIQSYPSR